MFKLIFDPGSSGIANQILMKLGLEPRAFLADHPWAMAIVILLSIWTSIGYVMIIYLGGLLGISQDIYDAVSLEAITPWKKLTKIQVTSAHLQAPSPSTIPFSFQGKFQMKMDRRPPPP